MPLRKPTNFLNMDLTFTVAGKGVVNNAGDLKLDAADGFFIAPQKGIKFGALGASAKAIDFSASGIDSSGCFLYCSSNKYWRGDGFLNTTTVQAGFIRGSVFIQQMNTGMSYKTLKCTVSAIAPGAGYGGWRFEPGTNAGTAKIVVYAGTSTAGTVIQDNIGAGF